MSGGRTAAYNAGFGLLALLIVIGLALWLPDPVRFGPIYWIELLNYLVYALALPPIIWLVASLRALHRARRERSAAPLRLLRTYLRWAGVILSAAAALIVAWAAKHPVPAAIVYGIALLVALAALVAEHAAARRRRRIWIAIVVWIGLLALLLCPTGYMVTYPGMMLNMQRYAHVEGGATPNDSLSGVLVFERPAFPFDWMLARLFPHYSFERIQNLGMSIGEYDTLVRTMKADANTLASAVAMGKVGIGQGVRSQGVQVAAVLKGGVADGVLRAGDVITQVNGGAVKTVTELTAAMKGIAPGTKVKLTVKRGTAQVELTVGTQAHPDDASRAAFGIQVSDLTEPDVPRRVDFRDFLLHEGGPSHGAMLALTLIDQLTPGGVTFGNRVAGTGTIEPDGSVGQIGGLEQKAYTVGRTGADVFFVPAGQEQEARRGSAALNIVPVRTLDDMLQWLATHPKRKAG